MSTASKELTIAEVMFTLSNGLRFKADRGKELQEPKRELAEIVEQLGFGEKSFNHGLEVIRGRVKGTLTAAIHYATAFMRDLSFNGHADAVEQYVPQFEQALRDSPYII